MKVVLEIPDNKVSMFLDYIKDFKFVKSKSISAEKELLLKEIQEAVENLKLAKQGKLNLKTARDLYNEL